VSELPRSPSHAAPRVAVVGGGLAGITAALRCAEAGCAVTLLESRTRLGGLAGSFRRGGLDVDTGQHVFLRCCTAYRALLDALGVADLVTLQPRLDVPVLAPERPPARLRRNGLPAPMHLAGALLRYRPLPVVDRIRLVPAALALRAVEPADPATDRRSFADWLAEHGQGARAVEVLWDLIGTATLNARAASASLALAASVFRMGLLTDPAAGDLGWSRVPLGRLHDGAARRALAAAGVDLRTATRVRKVERTAGGGWRVAGTHQGHGVEVMADRVVCAVPPTAAARRATVLDFFVTREPHATFRPAPGSAALRPPASTAAPGLFLAGAWTDTGWPATMEGAVRSGETAALLATDPVCGRAAA
jgi:hydroxysqualene dehydroxylase